MYDRPEIRAETDAFWAALREAVRDRGIDAPEGLERDRPPRLVWSAPELVIGQTCGLPYVRALEGRVGLLGAPAYALEGCEPGFYRSAVVVAADSRAQSLADLAGQRPAINARDSQSGYAALMYAAAPLAREGAFFGEPLITGAHLASIEAVTTGRAEVAAIDAVTWALAVRHDRAETRVRVLQWTEPTPGLPYITGRRAKLALLAEAVDEAIAALDPATREALLLTGFRRFSPADYAVIRERLAEASAVHRLPAAVT